MKLGLFTMPLHPPGSNVTETLQADLDQIVALDRLGYSEAWIGEHFTAEWENIPAPDLFIAHALAKTENIVLGTGVTCMPNHNPFVLAHRIAQLDHLARGRFAWGIGSGDFPGDLDVFGFDAEAGEHRNMTKAAVDLVLKLWEDPKPGVYRSDYWDFTIPEEIDRIGLRYHLKPYQLPHPPIAVAGVSPNSGTLMVAGLRGWIPMSINTCPVPTLSTHWSAVEKGAERSGRTPDRSTWRIARDVFVAESSDEARSEAINGVLARDYLGYTLPLLREVNMVGQLKVDPEMPDADVTPEYLADNIWVVGTPDEVAAKLREIHETVGGFGVLLAMGHEWQPKEKWERSMTLLAQEVLPQLADLS